MTRNIQFKKLFFVFLFFGLMNYCFKEKKIEFDSNDPVAMAKEAERLSDEFFEKNEEKWQQAYELARKAYELNDKDKTTIRSWSLLLSERAHINFMNKKFDDAIKYAKEAFKIDKKNDAAINTLSASYYLKGDLKEALEYALEFLKQHTEDYTAWGEAGKMYYELKKYEKAIKYLDKALELIRGKEDDKQLIAYNYFIGISYYRTGELKKSAYYLEKFLDLLKKNNLEKTLKYKDGVEDADFIIKRAGNSK
ncbi:tetratricopeptide repeat protein [Leptospira kanakyensis]|nr:tetratricopeptide repeat protein [Leptospira kanakyensis]